jgi:hypothetical protein
MCCIDGQENKYSVLNECSRMLKYNILKKFIHLIGSGTRVPLDNGVLITIAHVPSVGKL